MQLSALFLVFRLVRRELLPSLRHFGVLIGCIALGVAAIMAVATLSRALNDGLAREGRIILGGDAAFTLVQREASPAELKTLESQGRISQAIFSRAMARSIKGESLLSELKGVDSLYPLAGSLTLSNGEAPLAFQPDLIGRNAEGLYGLIVEPLLAGRIGVSIGDSVEIGAARFVITAFLMREPDRLSAGLGFGPRSIASMEAVRATGLIQPGSLTRFAYRLDIGANSTEAALDHALQSIEKSAPDAGWQVGTRMRASPNLQRQIGRFTQFLTLVGLTALLIGGVGVANATRAFAERQIPRIATLKSLGASSTFVLLSSLAQVLSFALLGVLGGVMLGTFLPWLGAVLARDLLPFPLEIGFYPREIGLGLIYGAATALAFGLWPLLRARRIPATRLFREGGNGQPDPINPIDLAIVAIAMLAFGLLVLETASERRIASLYLLAAIGAVIALRVVSFAVMRIARSLPRPKSPIFGLALANLYRPGSLTPSVILSLGLGLTLIVSLLLIDLNLTRQFRASLPGIAPNFFFIDIPSREIDKFEGFLKEKSPAGTIERVPQLRGRILEIRGVPAAQLNLPERVSWILDGDRGITYAANPPEGSSIAEGRWWPDQYRGIPLVSFAKDIANEIGLKVGDKIAVNVLGRRIEAEIANLREVRWQRLGINFVMVFSPNTFAGAPHTFLATLSLGADANETSEIAFARAVANAFPAISSVRVKDAISAIDQIVSQLAFAIRVSSLIALIASVMVLGGALAASSRSRQKEAVVLKTLGATRATLLKAMLVEYSALGAIAVVFGIACGIGGAGFVVSSIMKLEFSVPWLPTIGIAIAAFFSTIILGLIGTWHILGQKPAAYLRYA